MNNKLKAAIKDNYRSQTAFAGFLGVSDSLVSMVIRGSRRLSRQERQRWALKLRCRVEEIFPDNA